MCFKLLFFHSKGVLQLILSLTSCQIVFLVVRNFTPLFSLTVPNFVVFFEVVK